MVMDAPRSTPTAGSKVPPLPVCFNNLKKIPGLLASLKPVA